MKLKRATLAIALALGATFGLTGCSSYSQGEILSVEDDMGIDGPVRELEVVSSDYEGMEEPPSYEVHVSSRNTECQTGRFYPACDDKDKDGKGDYLESLQDDDNDDD